MFALHVPGHSNVPKGPLHQKVEAQRTGSNETKTGCHDNVHEKECTTNALAVVYRSEVNPNLGFLLSFLGVPSIDHGQLQRPLQCAHGGAAASGGTLEQAWQEVCQGASAKQPAM
eukprot:1158245-Pelagomonas_calceolata.AAC.6